MTNFCILKLQSEISIIIQYIVGLWVRIALCFKRTDMCSFYLSKLWLHILSILCSPCAGLVRLEGARILGPARPLQHVSAPAAHLYLTTVGETGLDITVFVLGVYVVQDSWPPQLPACLSHGEQLPQASSYSVCVRMICTTIRYCPCFPAVYEERGGCSKPQSTE